MNKLKIVYNAGYTDHKIDHILTNIDYKVDGSECWRWTASLDSKGYGQLTGPTPNTIMRAHRVVFQLFNGKIENDLHVLHSGYCVGEHGLGRCCVNPSHLRLGTHSDNMLDVWKHGTGNGVLQECDVVDIYTSNMSQAECSRKYKVDKSVIAHVRERRTWKWVTESLHKGSFRNDNELPITVVEEIYLSKEKTGILAAKFSIHPSTVTRIRAGKSRGDITSKL